MLADRSACRFPLRWPDGHGQTPDAQRFTLDFASEPEKCLNLCEDIEQLDIQDLGPTVCRL
jgi:hypothetical protein